MTGFDGGVANIVTIKNDITQVFSDLTMYFYETTNFFQYFSIIFLLITALTTVVTFGTQLVICFRAQNKCHAVSCLTRSSVAVIGLSAVGVTGILLVFVLLNFSVGGLCDFAYEGTFSGGSISGIAETVPTSTQTLMSEACMKKTDDDSVEQGKKPEEYIAMDAATAANFKMIGEFLHGQSTFSNFLKTKDQDDANTAIAQTEKEWDLYKTGILFNFDNVEGTLSNLNTKVNACQEEWVLNSQNCTSVQTGNLCRSVSTTDTFDKNRDCISSKQEAQDSFDKMKNYLQGQAIMMNKMILDLSGGQETSPRQNFLALQNNFSSVEPDFDPIVASLSQTFKSMSNYQGGYYNMTNCLVIRREMLMFSAGVCFSFRPNSQNVFFYLMLSTPRAL